MAHSGDMGMLAIASGYAINVKPKPEMQLINSCHKEKKSTIQLNELLTSRTPFVYCCLQLNNCMSRTYCFIYIHIYISRRHYLYFPICLFKNGSVVPL